MTLLITLIAAVIITIVWYTSPKARKLKVGLMCYMYWGASIMWLVDALFEYKEQERQPLSLCNMAQSFLPLMTSWTAFLK